MSRTKSLGSSQSDGKYGTTDKLRRPKNHELRKAVIESLESRVLLSSTWTVTNTNDDGNGSTLRNQILAAVNAANASHTNSDVETVDATSLSGTITLSGTALAINNTFGTVVIEGPGAGSLAISAGNSSGVFSFALHSKATVTGFTIKNGSASGVSNLGTLTINNCTISGNSGTAGGGIYNDGHITVSNSAINSNIASNGGGIYDGDLGVLTIAGSQLNQNSASKGGGIWEDGQLTMSGSTLNSNTASVSGGGIYNLSPSTLNIVDSTITASSNWGIYDFYGEIIVTDSTISGNTGGINDAGGSSFTYLYGTIVARNKAIGDLSGSNFYGTYNLIGDGSGGFTIAGHNIVPTPGHRINPLLAPLGDYSNTSVVPTMALLPGSPALDAGAIFDGPNGAINADERGVSRTANGAPDIGAFESQGFNVSVQATPQSAPFNGAYELLFTVQSLDPNLTDLTNGVINVTAQPNQNGASIDFTSPTTAGISGNTSSVGGTANSIIGSYSVTGTASPSDGSFATVELTNSAFIPPTVALDGPALVDTGGDHQYSLSVVFPTADDGLESIQTERIDWGDGSSTSVNPTSPQVDENHIYQSAGTYNLVATVTTVDGSTYTSTFNSSLTAVDAPSSGVWVPVTGLSNNLAENPRLLPNGDVLNLGSYSQLLSPDAAGNYANLTQVGALSPMNEVRATFPSQVLPSGQVFVAGGESNTTTDNAAEIYSPSSNSWAGPYPPSSFFISDAESELLPDGRILVGQLFKTDIFDPTSLTWTPGPNPLGNQNEASWVKLPDGSILTVDLSGGGTSVNTAERYIPASGGIGQWVATAPSNMPGGLDVQLFDGGGEIGPAVLLPNGTAIFFGATGHTAIFTPSTTSPYGGSWSQGPDLPTQLSGNPYVAADTPAAVLPNGKVLLFAQSRDVGGPPIVLEYDYTNSALPFTPVGNVPQSIQNEGEVGYVLDLPDGGVMIGNTNEEFRPTGSANASWQPVINTISLNSSGAYTLTGTQLNGISEGADEGDDAGMATNYPLIRLTSNSSSNVYYANASNWTLPGQVATGSQLEQVNFALPFGLPSGVYSLQVVANGIASNPVTFVEDAVAGNNYTLRVSPTDSTQDQLLQGSNVLLSAPIASISGLVLDLATGDTLTVDGTYGNPAPPAVISVNGGNTIVNIGSGSSIGILPSADNLTIQSGTVTLPAQSQTPASQPGLGPLNIQLGSLSIASGASLVASWPPGHANRTIVSVSTLSIPSGATLDLGGNELLINYGSGSDPMAFIASEILSGYNSGSWNGTGITSSEAAAVDAVVTNSPYGLGFADAADATNPANLEAGQIEVMYTLLGDANLDGRVNGSDFAILALNLQTAGSWDQGDFNYDNRVNGSDFAFLTTNFNQGDS
jgi:hypothetical protein